MSNNYHYECKILKMYSVLFFDTAVTFALVYTKLKIWGHMLHYLCKIIGPIYEQNIFDKKILGYGVICNSTIATNSTTCNTFVLKSYCISRLTHYYTCFITKIEWWSLYSEHFSKLACNKNFLKLCNFCPIGY